MPSAFTMAVELLSRADARGAAMQRGKPPACPQEQGMNRGRPRTARQGLDTAPRFPIDA